MPEPKTIIDNTRHHLGLATLAHLTGDVEAAKQHTEAAVRWAKAWQPHEASPELQEQYDRMVSDGRTVRNLGKNNGNPPISEQNNNLIHTTEWQPTSDQMGMTMTSGQLTYTVHPQPGRNSTNQWKWGVEENQKNSWSEDWYPDEESARQAAEKHADELEKLP